MSHDCERNDCRCSHAEHMEAMYGALRCPKCLPDSLWLDAHVTNLFVTITRALRIPHLADWLDRQLRRWPWLYRHLDAQ